MQMAAARTRASTWKATSGVVVQWECSLQATIAPAEATKLNSTFEIFPTGQYDAPVIYFADIDECADGSAECEQICLNLEGSFRCACQNGFALNKDGRTCYGQYQSFSLYNTFSTSSIATFAHFRSLF